MASPIILLTAIESGFGFLLTSTILYIVLSNGRRAYHYLFSVFLLVCAIWDLGTFVIMIRNEHVEEVVLIGRIIIPPCILIPALMFHFTDIYTGRNNSWAVAMIWVVTGISTAAVLAGLIYRIEGIYAYDWGNIFRVVPSAFNIIAIVFWYGINLPAVWFLIKGAGKVRSKVERRHYLYITSGFLAVTFAAVKALVTMGLNTAVLLPLGMFLNDIFVAVIGLAIIKDRLFDITVIVKKGTLYSLLAGLLIFIYSFSEHVLITYFGKLVEEYSELAHLISIAIGIAVLMPVKKRLEQTIEGFFAKKRLEF